MTDTNSSLATLEPFVSHRSFTLWRWAPHPTRTGERIKVPVHYDGHTRHSLPNPKKGQTGNPAPPLTAEEARAWQAHHHAQGDTDVGIGFRPSGTGLVCIDIDACLVNGQWSEGAKQVMARFPGALIEQSVSGKGAHIWVHAPGAPVGRRGQVQTPLGKLEMYADGQFLAAGRVLGGQVQDHTAAVTAMLQEFWPAQATEGPSEQVQAWEERPLPERSAVLSDLGAALAYLDPDSRDEWISVGQALCGLGEDGYALWAAWSARSSRFPGGDGLDKWETFSGERSDYRSVLAKAQRVGWVNPASRPDVTARPAEQLFESAAQGLGASPLPAGALLEPPPSRAVAPATDLSFLAASGGEIKPTVASIEAALLSPEAGVAIAYDTFKDRISISVKGAPWRPFRDTDYGRLRAAFERRGFKAVPAETMQTAVAMVAETNQFDSLTDWANTLQWDGVRRIERLLPDYYGTEDTPYTRAVGAYMFTTLGGRALVPGVKADMAVIMVGLQGARKTSSLSVLLPEASMLGEVDLGKDEDTIARKLRGKSLIELAEMRGFKGRDADANKAWVSRQVEEWTPKYKEFNTSYQRRCLIVGTANDEEQLDDPTGARRFLPTTVGTVDLGALERDRDQLWAEGIAQFRATGIAWQEAERLAKAEHHRYEVVDERLSRVADFMDSVPPPLLGETNPPTTPRSERPIRGVEILTTCFGMALGQIKKSDEMALSKIMKRLNYRRVDVWDGKKNIKMWIRGGEEVAK